MHGIEWKLIHERPTAQVAKKKKVPKYCNCCGKKLVKKEGSEYDVYTGKRVKIRACPLFFEKIPNTYITFGHYYEK